MLIEILIDISLKMINLNVQPHFVGAKELTSVYIPDIPHTTQQGEEIATRHEKIAQVGDVYSSRYTSSVNKHTGAKGLQMSDRCTT